MHCSRIFLCAFCLLSAGGRLLAQSVAADAEKLPTAEALASRVTIYRDDYGLAHVFGEDDESTVFGFGYVQAEDFFWQLEDVYILALGRYSEVHGPQGLNSDSLNRAFEIVPRSRRDFPALDRDSRRLYAAFVEGINHFLKTHPEVKPRLIAKFEPWHVLAYYRQVALELSYRLSGLSDEFLPRRNPKIWPATGSNGWALSGVRTAAGDGPQRTARLDARDQPAGHRGCLADAIHRSAAAAGLSIRRRLALGRGVDRDDPRS
jgi:acyl-homoserine lactone acylase PvdQ